MNNDNDSPLKFPCKFPIKVMGRKDSCLGQKILPIIHKYAPDFNDTELKINESAKGKYVSITVTINATSRDQLDNIYREVTALKEVLMVL